MRLSSSKSSQRIASHSLLKNTLRNVTPSGALQLAPSRHFSPKNKRRGDCHRGLEATASPRLARQMENMVLLRKLVRNKTPK